MMNLQSLFGSLYNFAQERFNFERPPKLFLKKDEANAADALGKTAYYDPNEESITIFVSQRHPKDILRSFAHELVHHGQNLNGELTPEKCGDLGPGYAQKNKYMRDLEMKAFRDGNLCFRDWTDQCKMQGKGLFENKIQKENKQMTTQISKEELKDSIIRALKEGNPAAENTKSPSVRESTEKRIVKIPKSFLKDVIGKILKEQDNMSRELDGGMSTPDIASFPEDPMPAGMSTPDDFDPEVEEMGDRQQRILRKAGFRNMEQLQKMVGAKTTGFYDQQTMDRIKRFQTRLGIKADGLYGPATRRALMKSSDAAEPIPDEYDVDLAAFAPTVLGVADQAGKPFPADQMAKVDAAIADDEDEDESTAVRESEELDEAGCGNHKRDDDVSEKKECPDCKGRSGPCPKCKEKEELDEAGCGNHKRDDELEENAFVLAADTAADQGKKQFEFPKGSGKMHPVNLKKGGDTIKNESKIQTPEQEKALYESRFSKRNDEIFNRLTKLWSKG